MDKLLQILVAKREQGAPVGGRDGELSPITEQQQEQEASSGGTIQIEESAEGQPTP